MQSFIFERTTIELVLFCLVLILGKIAWDLLVKFWVLRCLLAKQMEWTDNFIDEIIDSANYAICNEVKRRNEHYDEERLKMFIPTTLSTAKDSFMAELERVDRRLLSNGIAKLAASDTQFVLSTLYK